VQTNLTQKTLQVKWLKTGEVSMSRPTISISLDQEARKKLKKQIRQTKDRKMADRLRVILYKADGQGNKVIAKLLQIGRNQVSKLLQRYRQGGLPALLEPDNYQGSSPKLSQEQQQILKVELKTNIYATAFQVMAWVEQQWDVKYGVRGMHQLLRRLGFSYKKNRLVPSKADPELQRLFVQWLAGLRARMGPDELLLYSDAAHFKHNAEAGYAWSLKGEPHLIPANTGRQRYNVLGAYDPHGHEYYFLLTADNINQDKLIEFLGLLRVKFPAKHKLYLLLDNASYNHALRVKAEARKQRIILDYLPPYSPNLNPIERLWKFVRKKFFKDKYRDTFAKFCTQLDDFFANLDRYRDQLASLITENFEVIPESWQIP
jgi:transposase